MLIEVITLHNRWRIDSPWRRLYWTLPTALLIWSLALIVLVYFMGKPTPLSTLQSPIDAQLIELSSPVKTILPKLPRSKPVNKIKSLLSNPVHEITMQPPSQAQSSEKTLVAALSAPVTLPETNLPDRNKEATGTSQPVSETLAAYLNNPKPIYPALAKRMRMEGTVILKVLISKEGSTVKIEIARSSGYEILDKAAAESVKKWHFIPVRQGDSPVDKWVQVPVAFHLTK